ncbi:MAG TPA: PEPxxWA-CTERM sorting domain-containing protein [Caulobacteraceae bacterium]|jgi:hypothetical protein
MLATSASAAVFDFSILSAGNNDAASGQFTASSLGGDDYLVTGVTGTADGSAITGLSSYGGADQQLHLPGSATQSLADRAGIAFMTASLDYNIFAQVSGVPAYSFCRSDEQLSCTGTDANDTPTDATFTVTAATGTPEPASWAMMLLGIAGVGGVMRTTRRKLAALRPAI